MTRRLKGTKIARRNLAGVNTLQLSSIKMLDTQGRKKSLFFQTLSHFKKDLNLVYKILESDFYFAS